ncbi:MAG: DUF1700 domain-containing protein [Dorea sp.]|jgi:hypothetical protein|nr:DUF1700 domain-containing protein [Dorea sp.]
MTKNEFLDRLKEALGNDLAAPKVQENVDYYNQYILDEVKGGRNERDVIDELGDPWVIARTIIDASEGMQGMGTDSSYAYESNGQGGSYERQGGYVKRAGTSSRGWWKLIVLLLGIIGVLIAVVAVVGGILSLVAPILIPVLVVMVIIRSFSRRR